MKWDDEHANNNPPKWWLWDDESLLVDVVAGIKLNDGVWSYWYKGGDTNNWTQATVAVSDLDEMKAWVLAMWRTSDSK